jgi:hypothetical protein
MEEEDEFKQSGNQQGNSEIRNLKEFRVPRSLLEDFFSCWNSGTLNVYRC